MMTHPPEDHPPPPPPPGELPPPRPQWAALDQMKDEDVLRFAPPEIRRIWKRVVNLEQQLADVKDSLRRIEEILKARGGAG